MCFGLVEPHSGVMFQLGASASTFSCHVQLAQAIHGRLRRHLVPLCQLSE